MTAKKKDEEAPAGDVPSTDVGTIETGTESDEVVVSERDRVPTDTAVDVEPLPSAQAELERIRAEEDEQRKAQEESAQADNELKAAINAEKEARDQELKLGFGTPTGTTVDERVDVELGNCLACGKPVTAADGYVKYVAGITHMHECSVAYQDALNGIAKSRDVSHEPNEVRHPNLAAPRGAEITDASPGEPLNVAQGTTALPGENDTPTTGVEVTVPKVGKFDTPIRDAVAKQQKDTEEFAAKQQASGEYVKNP